MDQLASVVDAACDQMIGLALEDLAVDGGLTEAPCGGELAGRSPVDRGTTGRKRATIVAPAARHDSPLLDPTRDGLERFTPVAEPPTVHLDRGDDSALTRERLAQRDLVGCLDHRPQDARLVHRAAGTGDRLLAPLLGRAHHRRPPGPRGLDPLPMGRPTPPQAVRKSLLAQALISG